jgi:hypothetical protein
MSASPDSYVIKTMRPGEVLSTTAQIASDPEALRHDVTKKILSIGRICLALASVAVVWLYVAFVIDMERGEEHQRRSAGAVCYRAGHRKKRPSRNPRGSKGASGFASART